MSLESLAQTRIRLIDNEPNELPKEVTRHSNQQPVPTAANTGSNTAHHAERERDLHQLVALLADDGDVTDVAFVR